MVEKRVIEIDIEESRGANNKRGKNVKEVQKERQFIKYSQTIDIKKVFNLHMRDNKVYNSEGNQIMYITMNKNVKIRNKLDSIIKYLQKIDKEVDNNKEIIMISINGEAIQKMISIVEILKQKVKQIGNEMEENKFNNNSIAKVVKEGNNNKGNEIVSDGELEYNYYQLNYVDYKIEECNSKKDNKDIKDNNIKDISSGEGIYSRKVINEVLKVDKVKKIPVMYIYMKFHKSKSTPINSVNQIKELMNKGWSIQQN